ncbi:MAG: M43 family zinc metalloprotease, partial [Flavobacteriales bacterium]
MLTHEVGHWLNLMHCWGDSNSPGDDANCFMDDEVEDTPLTRGWTSCVLTGASCGSALDNVQNFMEYAYCARMFTEGQAARMLAALNSPIAQREALWQPSNLLATGVLEDPILCAARFSADRRTICPGATVRFTDQSYNGVAQRTWSFPGGEPASSTAAQPEVTYPQPGLYAVALSVSDGTNTLEASEPACIRVLPGQGEPLPWSEGFEGAEALPNERWEVIDPSGDGGFALTSAAASSGMRSARLSNGPQAAGRRDELVSATIDLSGAEAAYLTFRYAFAQRITNIEDALHVWVSGNCGDAWVLRKVLRPATGLITAGTVEGTFVPTASQWRTAYITNIAPHFCTERFRLRFEFVNQGGNDLYIDDINVTGSAVGLSEAVSGPISLRVAVGPGERAEALVVLEQRARFGLELRDA